MNNKKQWLLITLMTLISLSPLTGVVYSHWQKNNFSCKSDVTVGNDEGDLSVSLDFTFDDGRGQISSVGMLKDKNGKINHLMREMKFEYYREKGSIVMVSDGPNVYSPFKSGFGYSIPDFFLYKDRGINIRMVPNGIAGYVVLMNNLPTFYCQIDR